MADIEPSLRGHLDHGSFSMELIATHGDIALWLCDKCHLVQAFCSHENMEWVEDFTKLICTTCGLDGT